MRSLNEDGSGYIAYFFILIAAFGLFMLFANPIADGFTDAMNDQLEIDSIPATQERFDAFNTALLFFVAAPITLLIGALIYFWLTASQESSGDV